MLTDEILTDLLSNGKFILDNFNESTKQLL